MQVTMTMEEYEDLTFKNKKVIEELEESYNSKMLAMKNITMLEIRKLRSDKEKLESKINNEGCEFCNELKSLYYDRSGVIQEVYIEPDKTLSVSNQDVEYIANIKINYCPMCGKKLGD